jgi:hypothetical protein
MSGAPEMKLIESFPLPAMREQCNWVGFRVTQKGQSCKKTPYIADAPRRLADVSDPTTWRPFDVALRGLAARKYNAVGYALDGSGIVGIDLDGDRWLDDERDPTPEAQTILERCGSYAERSLRRGIHILLAGDTGDGKNDRRNRVEVYSRGRFLIATGDRLDDCPAELKENPAALRWLMGQYIGQAELPEKAESAEKAEHAENTEAIASAYSAVSAYSADRVIDSTIPKSIGERNSLLLNLARGLKFDAGMAKAGFAELRPLVRKWHGKALAIIATKDFDTTWMDFQNAWRTAKYPLSFKADSWAFQQARTLPLPPEAAEYDSEPVKLTVAACCHLNSIHPGRPFFLSSHRAAAELKIGHDRALRMLHMLAGDGRLEIIERGNERRANRYRWLASASVTPPTTAGPSEPSTPQTGCKCKGEL